MTDLRDLLYDTRILEDSLARKRKKIRTSLLLLWVLAVTDMLGSEAADAWQIIWSVYRFPEP